MKKENTIRGLFAGIRVYLREIVGLTEQRNAFTIVRSCKVETRDKNSLFKKVISQKRVR